MYVQAAVPIFDTLNYSLRTKQLLLVSAIPLLRLRLLGSHSQYLVIDLLVYHSLFRFKSRITMLQGAW